MKSLSQIEPRTPISTLPFTISVPGAYYVTDNLTGVAGQPGISIDADNVTLDLGGFELVGPGSGVTAGIQIINNHVNTTIRNGTVRGWLSNSVVASTATSTEMQVENLRVVNGGVVGILLGNNGTAKGCEVRACVGAGISAGLSCKIVECTSVGQTGASADGFRVIGYSIVTNCVASGNGGDGFQLGPGCVVTHCVSQANAIGFNSTGGRSSLLGCTADSNNGIGFSAGSLTTVSGCSARNNADIGFSLSDAVAVLNCTSSFNTGNGYSLGIGATITNCTAAFNTGVAGIATSSAAVITGCVVRASTNAGASSAGITTGTESLVSQCVVSNIDSSATTLTATTGMGISAASSCTLERNTVQGCRGDGIRATSRCVIRDNTSDANGSGTGDGAGIHVTSSANRIEGNNVTNNDRGIEVTSSRSLVIRNSAGSNGIDYVIAASNRYGPVVNITASGSAAVGGNIAAVSTLTSTDPWANFSY